ncbi:uncharacterized protein LOC134176846 [Corticium candelabrum]|uniref:uncharacterized protein LOC134176846 n=1 Tax=Corticium candelabrum TaxID=121492 RepID=UPI002E26D626|nr:uncharacterized protein LOC134176846 [Corticium candelabrum]
MATSAATTEDVLEENGNTGAVSSEISLPQPTATLSHLLPIPSASHSLTKTTENTAHKTLFSYSSTFGLPFIATPTIGKTRINGSEKAANKTTIIQPSTTLHTSTTDASEAYLLQTGATLTNLDASGAYLLQTGAVYYLLIMLLILMAVHKLLEN